MTIQRLAPAQISTDSPLEAAREATWRALAQAGLSDVLIDREKNIVAGSNGARWNSNGETVLAAFSQGAFGTLIDVKVQSHFGGRFDGLRVKRRSKKMADAIETALAQPAPMVSDAPPAPPGQNSVLPIAAPTGGTSFVLGAPVYGAVLPAKRGKMILTYAILGLVLFHILSPFAWYYANKALKDYGEHDPGDIKQVKIGRILGIIGTVVLLGIYGVRFYAASR